MMDFLYFLLDVLKWLVTHPAFKYIVGFGVVGALVVWLLSWLLTDR
jgi:hypothetical protein